MAGEPTPPTHRPKVTNRTVIEPQYQEPGLYAELFGMLLNWLTVIGVGLAVLYGLVKFVKWAWE